ncbi:hypothetical protein ACP6JD_004397 [Aspergillus fumigatus]|uniref:ER membrane protein complex subunit 7 beta-sandwich domain-containing protein n=1 Tax=Aspergillus fumigatus (strain CBS 144.89 / FGSC A1163 / CEA10) TaxID=451804 RepID=B0Y335_ASPFC|nr:conserved hypothetical protein [Aspergillus fumigatus A1163]
MSFLRSSLSALLLFVAATCTTVLSASLTITIPPSNLLPNPNTLPAGTHATLTSLPSLKDREDASSHVPHPLTAPLTRSASFVFRNLKATKPESYLLDIRSAEYVFAPYRVDVSADGTVLGVWETYRGNPWDNRGREKFVVDAAGGNGAKAAEVMVEAKILARRGFYEERARLDPEMRAEFEKQSRTSPISGATRNAMAGGGGPGNFDLAGWMAGATPRQATGTDSEAARGTATGRETGGTTRRRG